MAKKPTRIKRHAVKRTVKRPVAPARGPSPAVKSDTQVVNDATEPRGEWAGPTVVAVGASAGGLDAFSQILEHLPAAPNVAFVFIQHLSPQHESALPTLLSSRTRLPVVEVTDGMRVAANHVYVMPSNAHMGIKDGRLTLLPRPIDRSQFTPIDAFFESLARSAQERAIGVILSGTASDGALGIREIKAAGGITIAQSPESARYDGMPHASIATGLIDLVLSPREIAEQVSDVRKHVDTPGKSVAEASGSLPNDDQFRELFILLRRASGIDFKQYKTPTVKRRLLRRMALQRLTDVGSYLNYLREHQSEVAALCDDLLIHVTRFFRDPDSFKALETSGLSELALERSDDPIRVWVPGCATGEEAYTVAIVLMEALGDQAADRRIQIFATDVSDSTIEHARSGSYGPGIAADVSPERLRRFFTKADGGYRVSKPLRDLCVFARHDLARDPPFSRLDLLMCRNVLIYLDVALQRRLISEFQYAVKPGRFLMLGSAETVGPQAAFALVDKKWRLYRRTPGESGVRFPPASERLADLHQPPSPAAARSRADLRSVPEEASRIVLDKYGPPGVVVDANLDIVHFRGHTGLYLESASGEPSLNLLKMARGGLLHPLRSALQTVRKKGQAVRREGVIVEQNGSSKAINLDVAPLSTGRGEFFLVLFEAPANPAIVPKRTRKSGVGAESSQRPRHDARVGDLRRELAANRDYLQSIIQDLEAANEELQSANEEILSSNEELQSTNEELDTAKEELQSTNEELNTLNDELQSRNQELAVVNSDLVNLLGSVAIPIVIVGSDMRVRRFTPAAERLFNLIPGDVGRPIGQIKSNLQFDNLEGLIRATIDGLDPHEEEVLDHDGRWYLLGVRPYRSIDHRVDGAVLTALDIDDSRRHQQHVERTRDYFMGIVETISQPLIVVDDQMRVRTANRSFYDLFETTPRHTEGKSIYQLDGGRWNTPELRSALTAAAAREGGDHVRIAHATGLEHATQVMLSVRGFELDRSKHWILIAMDVHDGSKAD